MGYGKAEKPCGHFKIWPSNPTLCGKCAWDAVEHASSPSKLTIYSDGTHKEVKGNTPGWIIEIQNEESFPFVIALHEYEFVMLMNAMKSL